MSRCRASVYVQGFYACTCIGTRVACNRGAVTHLQCMRPADCTQLHVSNHLYCSHRAIHSSSPCNPAFGIGIPTQHISKAPVHLHLHVMTQSAEQQHDTAAELFQPKALNATFDELPTTIFELMTRASMQHNSINLGQGGSNVAKARLACASIQCSAFQEDQSLTPELGVCRFSR